MSIRAVAAAAVFALGLVSQAAAQDGVWRDFMPPTRRGATLVHDTTRDRYVLFGGSDQQLRNEVWTLPADSTGWRQLAPGGSQFPSARSGVASVYDPLHDRIWLYGGRALSALSGALWALDADPEEWVLVTLSTGPSLRDRASLVRDSSRDRLLLYGGMTSLVTQAASGEVWSISPYSGTEWTRISVAGTPPPPRWNAIVAYDRLRDRLIVLGGENQDSVFADAWQLKFTPFPQWSRIVTVGNAPPRRQGALGALDEAHDRIVTFGGVDPDTGMPVDDIWSFALSGFDTWTVTHPAGDIPNELLEACATMDSARARIIVHGGGRPQNLPASYASNETWALDVSKDAPAWNRIVPAAPVPLPRYGAGSAFDLPHDAFWIFGGLTSVDGASTRSNELWRGSLSAPGTWAQVMPEGPAPAPRHEPSLGYDARSNRLFVFGGWDGSEYFGDTWTASLDGSPAWRPVATGGDGPKPRRAQATAWDASRRALFVFGGADGDSAFGDAWELPVDGSIAWRRIDAGDGPVPRAWATAVYDPPGDRMIVFGGMIDGAAQSDTWALTLGGTPHWTRLDTSGDQPGPRTRHAAAYDPVRRRMLVWGGFNADETVLASTPGTWALALDGAPVWTRRATTGPEPSPATSPAMLYDPRRDRMVTYGGSALFDDLLPDLRALEFGGNASAAWLVGARVEGASLRLEWQTVAAPGTPAEIEKRVDAYGDETRFPFDPPAGVWTHAFTTAVAGDGSVTWSDDHVGGGGAYSYRLVVGGSTTGATSVEVPTIANFALLDVLPSPTTGPLVLALRSTGTDPVHATLYDANGRRVMTRDLGMVPGGIQSVPLELPAGRRAGVYFLRVSQGGSAASRKIVIL